MILGEVMKKRRGKGGAEIPSILTSLHMTLKTANGTDTDLNSISISVNS
jgi:hypothetical protein